MLSGSCSEGESQQCVDQVAGRSAGAHPLKLNTCMRKAAQVEGIWMREGGGQHKTAVTSALIQGCRHDAQRSTHFAMRTSAVSHLKRTVPRRAEAQHLLNAFCRRQPDAEAGHTANNWDLHVQVQVTPGLRHGYTRSRVDCGGGLPMRRTLVDLTKDQQQGATWTGRGRGYAAVT
jgi:hypothetical protein